MKLKERKIMVDVILSMMKMEIVELKVNEEVMIEERKEDKKKDVMMEELRDNVGFKGSVKLEK